MSFKDALKIFVSKEESANDRAAAFAVILETLLDYIFDSFIK